MFTRKILSVLLGDVFRPGIVGGVLQVGTESGGQTPGQIPFQSIRSEPKRITASATLTVDADSGKIILLEAAAGLTVTLPRATGSGAQFEFFVLTAVTSNNDIIQVANADDVIQGIISATLVGTPTTNNGWIAASTSDTITLNGTTKGGLRGDWLRIRDIAPGVFAVEGVTSQSGTGATPFSAAVS